jgi:membrane protein YdbS with pleckstrin-like domain
MVKRKKQKKESEVILEYDFGEDGKGVIKKKNEPEVKIEQEEKPEEIIHSTEPIPLERAEEKKRKKMKSKKRKEELKEEIEAPVDAIIQALIDSEKTFVENINRNSKKSMFSSFYPFPKNITFMSVGKDEPIVLIVRHHWTGLISKGVLALFALLLPFLISYSVPTWFEGVLGSTFFLVGLFIFFMMISATILVDGFLKWFFQMNVITTKRIIDVDFVSITTHRVSETTFDQVQDVSHSPTGPFASFFDYGDLYIQTAGAKCEFEFNNIPRPRDVQDTILDLRELRKKKFAGIK